MEVINKNLFKRRLDKRDQPLDQIEPNFDDAGSVVEILKKTLENDEKCNIKGKIQLSRVLISLVHDFIGNRADSNCIQ